MKNAFKLFNFMGVPVYLKYWFFALLLFINFDVSFFIAIFVSVVVHELAHTYVAKKLNYHVEKVFIDLFYGGADVDSAYQYRHNDTLLIISAGPLSNLVMLGIGSLIIMQFPDIKFIMDLNKVNLVLFIFNILPIFPLDGGRISKALISIGFDKCGVISPNKKAKFWNGILSMVASVGLLVFSILSSFWISVLFSLLFIFMSYQEIVNKNQF